MHVRTTVRASASKMPSFAKKGAVNARVIATQRPKLLGNGRSEPPNTRGDTILAACEPPPQVVFILSPQVTSDDSTFANQLETSMCTLGH
jgi:hypothetical protein